MQCFLHVRTEGGERVCRIKAFKNEKLSEIFKLVFPYRESKNFTNADQFEFRTIMPIVAYPCNEKRTIDELGLAPKKALGLFVRPEFQVGFKDDEKI